MMKRKLWIPVLLLLAVSFWGCARDETASAFPVCILEDERFRVENNGQWIKPGEDAVFYLTLEPGYAVAGTDHAGGHSACLKGQTVELRLTDIQYPARIRLRLTQNFTTVTYCANGGEGPEVTFSYDLSNHARPNTAIGTDLFFRQGYTMTGWNTRPDGSGQRIGLGSRVTPDPTGVMLYAQWERWTPESDFEFTVGYGATITGYHGNGDKIVIPQTIQGHRVTGIGHQAFQNCRAGSLILPDTLCRVAQGAFQNCEFETVTLFDSIESISNDSFRECSRLRTVYINAAEEPYGYAYRKESCYADKVDMLIQAQGQKKLVFYGGCSVWYNLDGAQAEQALAGSRRVINMGLNGMANSLVQMQILGAFLEEGDILLHAPELSSKPQMMLRTAMDRDDDKLWCGLEYNYDLVSLVDFQTVAGLLDSFCQYLEQKEKASDYAAVYTDSRGNRYLDDWGGIPFERSETMEMLSDPVNLDPDYLQDRGMDTLKRLYAGYLEQGVRVYISYACVNMDAVAQDQRENGPLMDRLFRDAIAGMDGPVLISRLEDYLYQNSDFYDTNYHMRTEVAKRNTALWLRDLLAQMARDGLWEGV